MSDYNEYKWKADGKSGVDGSDKGKHAKGGDGGGGGCMVVAPVALAPLGMIALAFIKGVHRVRKA